MKITLCGSIAFYQKMLKVQKELETNGHEVQLPPAKFTDPWGKVVTAEEYYRIRHTAKPEDEWVWKTKQEAMRGHFAKVAWADAILVLNYDKNGIAGYIGANTLMEMGLALYLKKPIYLLNPVPQMQYTEEILGMRPVVVDGKLSFS